MEDLLANIQYVVGIVASFAIVGLKKIKLVDDNKSWLIPLIMIAVCVTTCFVNHVPHPTLAGVTIALAVCKTYDWITADKADKDGVKP